MARELRSCIEAGGNTTLMVWGDCDDNCVDGDALRELFWKEALKREVTKDEFDRVVFIFAKDRLENWIQFLLTGVTDESTEGPRVKHNREAAQAARRLADHCRDGSAKSRFPPSLQWSCRNWKTLVKRMGHEDNG